MIYLHCMCRAILGGQGFLCLDRCFLCPTHHLMKRSGGVPGDGDRARRGWALFCLRVGREGGAARLVLFFNIYFIETGALISTAKRRAEPNSQHCCGRCLPAVRSHPRYGGGSGLTRQGPMRLGSERLRLCTAVASPILASRSRFNNEVIFIDVSLKFTVRPATFAYIKEIRALNKYANPTAWRRDSGFLERSSLLMKIAINETNNPFSRPPLRQTS